MAIVTSTYRRKRPPRKRRKSAPLEVPTVIRIEKGRRVKPAAEVARSTSPESDRSSAIVDKRGPQMTPEEHKRRGDAADELFREMKRRIAETIRKP